MTHTMEQTADIKAQLAQINEIHNVIADAIDGKEYPCAMSALTSIMVDLYNAHTDEPTVEDYMNRMYAVYMADQMINKGEGETKQ